jgi:hypothetical protein
MIVDVIVSNCAGESASNSVGGRSPSAWCRRPLLNQPRYSTTASSSWERVRQTRSAISSVLKLSTKLSASALMLLICAHPQRQAWAWWVVRVVCARTPSLISVLVPGWLRSGDMMVDGVFRDAVRPLGL